MLHSIQNSEENLEINVNLLDLIINPKHSLGWRVRGSPTKIKILYQFYQYHKKLNSGEWQIICPSKEQISEHAQVSRRHVTEFINSDDAEIFLEVERRDRLPGSHKYQSNIYRLKPWLIEIFEFYEKTGMMRGFRADFGAWKRGYSKRFSKWLIPQIQKGLTLNQILEKKALMNKLSTEKELKGAAGQALKGAGIKYLSDSLIKPTGFISNTERQIPALRDFKIISQTLQTRFLLKEGDINMLMSTVDLRTHKKACRMGLDWLKNGLDPKNPVRVYQSCINRVKRK